MKMVILTSTLILSALFAFSQTQMEMNEQAANEYKKSDKRLSTVYNDLIKFLTVKKEKDLLINAEKTWINFRDAQAAYEENFYNGGSMQPMVYYGVMKELTDTRIKQLRESLNEQKGH